MNSEGELLTIGAVLNVLSREFREMDLTISKIRFLESQGLVVPARTPTGYRKFSPADVERLRYTLRMQNEHYLPLKVIRENLDRLDNGEEIDLRDGARQLSVLEPLRSVPAPEPEPEPANVPAPAHTAARQAVPATAAQATAVQAAVDLTMHELSAKSGLSVREVIDLEKSGIIRRTRDDTFGPNALQIAAEVAALAKLGMDSRHLRPLVVSAQNQADKIALLIESRKRAGRTQEARTAVMRDEAELVTRSLRLQLMLIRAQLAEQA